MDGRTWSLIREFTITDFKLKYHGSMLGYLWSLLNPLLIFSVLYIVFSVFMRFDKEYYGLYLLLGIIIWGYITEATTNAMQALRGKSRVIKNVYFPRTVVVLASNLTAFLGLLLNLIVFFLFFIISAASISLNIVWLPLFLGLLFLLVLGLSFIISAVNLRFQDVEHIWRIVLQIGFWATPVVYPLEIVPEQVRNLFLFNPFFIIIENIRNTAIYALNVNWESIILTVLYSLISFIIGYLVYKKLSDKFPEWV